MMMGADFYEDEEDVEYNRQLGHSEYRNWSRFDDP